MPNLNVAGERKRSDLRVSIDYIEEQTGYDLSSNVPVDIQRAIEVVVDNATVQ